MFSHESHFDMIGIALQEDFLLKHLDNVYVLHHDLDVESRYKC